MADTSPTTRLVVFTVASCAVVLSSCTLPPKQAWRKIRTEGLMAYVSYEMDSQHKYAHLKHNNRVNQPVKPSLSTPAPSPVLVNKSNGTVSPVMPLAKAPVNLPDDGRILAAHAVPSLPGFVRSPYTNPPRLVDVKGASVGSTMVCPYTGRPFIVPDEAGNTPSGSMVARNNPAPSKPSASTAPTVASNPAPPAPVVAKNNAPAPSTPATPSTVPQKSPTVASTAPAPAPSAPAPSQPKPVVASNTTPAPTTPAVNPPAPAPQTPTVPEGVPIAGRPGFVNSPYAAKHQLVDVTGLPAGMEVKCPYTGKLFRVPAQDVAASKPADAPAVASPEKKK